MIAVDFHSGQFTATTWRLLYASELRFSCDWTVINLILMWLSCDHIYVYCDGAATVLKATAIELRLFWRLLRLSCDYFGGYCDWTAIIFEATAIELRLFWRLLRLSCDYFESYCDWAAIVSKWPFLPLRDIFLNFLQIGSTNLSNVQISFRILSYCTK